MNKTRQHIKITATFIVIICLVFFLLCGCTPSKTEEEALLLLNNRGYTDYIKLEGRTLKQACIDFKIEEGRVRYLLKGTKGGYPELNVCYVFCLTSKTKAKALMEQFEKLGFYTELYGNVLLADTNNQ